MIFEKLEFRQLYRPPMYFRENVPRWVWSGCKRGRHVQKVLFIGEKMRLYCFPEGGRVCRRFALQHTLLSGRWSNFSALQWTVLQGNLPVHASVFSTFFPITFSPFGLPQLPRTLRMHRGIRTCRGFLFERRTSRSCANCPVCFPMQFTFRIRRRLA